MRNTADALYHVREGVNISGSWNIFVESDGEYEISFCRWAKKADATLRKGLPAFEAVDDTFREGKALPVHRANLRIGRQEYTKTVEDEDRCAVFEIEPMSGRTELQSGFYDVGQGNQLCGAYYVPSGR